MAEHTPTPWVVDEDPLEDKGYQTLITMPGKNGFQGTSIAYVNHNWNDAEHGERRISWAEAEANARHIVHCVNVHDDLVKALEELWDYARSLEKVIRDGVYQSEELNNPDAWKDADSFAYNGDGASMRDVVTTALARAKGGEG